MKMFRFLLLGLPFVLLAVARPVAADPATVIKIGEEAPCYFVWGGSDAAGIGHLVILEGTGILVASNNDRGNVSYQCHGELDFGDIVVAPEFPTGVLVTVRLATIEEACSTNPDACKGKGAFIASFENSGIPCGIPGYGPTTRYSQRVTPGGQVQLSCHLPE